MGIGLAKKKATLKVHHPGRVPQMGISLDKLDKYQWTCLILSLSIVVFPLYGGGEGWIWWAQRSWRKPRIWNFWWRLGCSCSRPFPWTQLMETSDWAYSFFVLESLSEFWQINMLLQTNEFKVELCAFQFLNLISIAN